MRILAIETSCDETAVAIIECGDKRPSAVHVLANIVSSQVKLHAKFGGVVPNLARREHERNLVPILIKALMEAKLLSSKFKSQKSKFKVKSRKSSNVLNSILSREPVLLKNFQKHILPLKKPDIDIIAVTYGPGLAPALWAGVNFAKALGALWNLPVLPINHMAGHLFSALLSAEKTKNKKQITNHKWNRSSKLQILNYKFPAIALLVSGGHTELVLMKSLKNYKIIGETVDDAAGEAFDKVARLLELGYPGGPLISKLAEDGDSGAINFPRPMLDKKNYDFSFSGLKTSVLYYLRDNKNCDEVDVAASFEQAAVDCLVTKTIRAAKNFGAKTILLGGGVAANKKLREELEKKINGELPGAKLFLPTHALTGDNALMIALAAVFAGKKKAPTVVGADANAILKSG